jgi:uncharacterized protein YndB with AHSA1/START domain
MDATLSTINGKPTLRFERRLRHAPAKVWRAVSDPAEMKHWFPAAVEAEQRPGAPMRFTFPTEALVDGTSDGEVLEVDEPKVYMFRWNQDVLRFELIPDGDGCRLVFTQTIGGGEVGMLGAGRSAAGWDACLEQLVAGLDGDSVPERTDWLTPMAHYIEKFDIGYGTVESGAVRFARDLVWKPPADVWAALTDAPPNPTVPAGHVVTSEAPTVLEYEWLHDGAPAGTVRWEIVSDPQLGVRVELTQTMPARLADLLPAALASWHVYLDQLFAATMGSERTPWPTDRVAELTGTYEERLR